MPRAASTAWRTAALPGDGAVAMGAEPRVAGKAGKTGRCPVVLPGRHGVRKPLRPAVTDLSRPVSPNHVDRRQYGCRRSEPSDRTSVLPVPGRGGRTRIARRIMLAARDLAGRA